MSKTKKIKCLAYTLSPETKERARTAFWIDPELQPHLVVLKSEEGLPEFELEPPEDIIVEIHDIGNYTINHKNYEAFIQSQTLPRTGIPCS